MAEKTFEFEVPEGTSAERLMETARVKARGAGIAIEGDATQGSFSGTAEGRYTVEGRTVRVDVDKKPAFVPWSLIEKGLRSTFG